MNDFFHLTCTHTCVCTVEACKELRMFKWVLCQQCVRFTWMSNNVFSSLLGFEQKSPGPAEKSGGGRLCAPGPATHGLPQRPQHHRGMYMGGWWLVYTSFKGVSCVTNTHRCRRSDLSFTWLPTCSVCSSFGHPAAWWINIPPPPQETRPRLLTVDEHDGN